MKQNGTTGRKGRKLVSYHKMKCPKCPGWDNLIELSKRQAKLFDDGLLTDDDHICLNSGLSDESIWIWRRCRKCGLEFAAEPREFKKHPLLWCPNCGEAFPGTDQEQEKCGLCVEYQFPEAGDDRVVPLPYCPRCGTNIAKLNISCSVDLTWTPPGKVHQVLFFHVTQKNLEDGIQLGFSVGDTVPQFSPRKLFFGLWSHLWEKTKNIGPLGSELAGLHLRQTFDRNELAFLDGFKEEATEGELVFFSDKATYELEVDKSALKEIWRLVEDGNGLWLTVSFQGGTTAICFCPERSPHISFSYDPASRGTSVQDGNKFTIPKEYGSTAYVWIDAGPLRMSLPPAVSNLTEDEERKLALSVKANVTGLNCDIDLALDITLEEDISCYELKVKGLDPKKGKLIINTTSDCGERKTSTAELVILDSNKFIPLPELEVKVGFGTTTIWHSIVGPEYRILVSNPADNGSSVPIRLRLHDTTPAGLTPQLWSGLTQLPLTLADGFGEFALDMPSCDQETKLKFTVENASGKKVGDIEYCFPLHIQVVAEGAIALHFQTLGRSKNYGNSFVFGTSKPNLMEIPFQIVSNLSHTLTMESAEIACAHCKNKPKKSASPSCPALFEGSLLLRQPAHTFTQEEKGTLSASIFPIVGKIRARAKITARSLLVVL